MKHHFHVNLPVFHSRHSQTPDIKSYRCAWIVQSMQDIAQVWMTTAGLVWCDIPICRKHGAKTATQSLYCRDPQYVPNPGTGPGRRPILYSTALANDWGCDATHVRDDDMKLVVKMIQGLFRGEIVNAPDLFHAKQAIFTSAETIQCLGLSTMSANAISFFKGDWWQWRQADDIRSLLDAVPAVYAGLDRLANNKDYCPYGKPETRQEATGGKTMRTEDGTREGSADTQPDNFENDGPSLGA